jgi:hypothetical protein
MDENDLSVRLHELFQVFLAIDSYICFDVFGWAWMGVMSIIFS